MQLKAQLQRLSRSISLLCFMGGASLLTLSACRTSGASGADSSADPAAAEIPEFSADSAFAYVKHQTDLGPRVPNTEAHRQASAWLIAQLKKRGAEVVEQRVTLPAFDGTKLNTVNIMGRFQPGKSDRVLLLAHYDCRPWADQDPDPAKRQQPVDGANDGASGVGILLELARQLQAHPLPEDAPGIDILFVDAEDWGTDGDDSSWALGTNYFVNNPIVPAYHPNYAILLDMVGSGNATFYKEYFSEQAASWLNSAIWTAAATAGYGQKFLPQVGGAVTDDHRPLIAAGIPAIDIIDYRLQPEEGFDPVWHTTADVIENISPETLKAVGQTLLQYFYAQ